jgi:hypothetical protein
MAVQNPAFEAKHPRAKGGSKGGQFKEKAVSWTADNPMMSRKGMIGSSAATTASSFFLMFDSVFRFIAAIFGVATISLVSWGGYRRVQRRRSSRGISRPITRVDRLLGTTRATSQDWSSPRNKDARAIVAKAQAKEIRRDGGAQRRTARIERRKATRKQVYTKVGQVAARARKPKAAPDKDVFVMSKDEMRSAADSIGLRLEGRRVQLLDVNESSGTALVIDKGAPRNVPVGKLDWDE